MSSTFFKNKFLIIGITGLGVLSALVFFTNEEKKASTDETPFEVSGKKLISTPSPSPKWSEKSQKAVAVSAEKNLSRHPALNKTFVEYMHFKRKVLKSESEKKDYENLFTPNSFSAIKDYLTTPESTIDIETNFQHQMAVSFLKEGLKFDKENATRIALEITLNGSVEDKSLSKDSRQLMAKDKAELMFHFTALAPDFKSKIKQANLGPVTESVLENVMSAQKLNLAESAKEVAKFNSQNKQK